MDVTPIPAFFPCRNGRGVKDCGRPLLPAQHSNKAIQRAGRVSRGREGGDCPQVLGPPASERRHLWLRHYPAEAEPTSKRAALIVAPIF